MTIITQKKQISAESDEKVVTNIALDRSTGVLTISKKDFYNNQNLADTQLYLKNIPLNIIKYNSMASLRTLENTENPNLIIRRESNIFLVPIDENSNEQEGIYREYLWVKDEETDSGQFEAIGSTRLNLDPYLEDDKVMDNLTTNTFDSNDPTVLSARQGYLLNQNKADKDHTHGSITSDGKITNAAANKPLITTTGGAIAAGSFEGTATNIKMNGTQAVGSRNTFARGDHVHPSDTTKVSLTDLDQILDELMF